MITLIHLPLRQLQKLIPLHTVLSLFVAKIMVTVEHQRKLKKQFSESKCCEGWAGGVPHLVYDSYVTLLHPRLS